jgi:hypothetical protein
MRLLRILQDKTLTMFRNLGSSPVCIYSPKGLRDVVTYIHDEFYDVAHFTFLPWAAGCTGESKCCARMCALVCSHGEVDALHSEFCDVSSLYYSLYIIHHDRLCGLVVRVHGYRSRSRVRFPAVPDFLISGSGMGSTQPRDYN